MGRVSRSKLSPTEKEAIKEHFTYLISSLNNASDIDNFLSEFLTEEEKLMLAKRLVLFMMLEREYPQSVIQSTLHMSYETIRTYKNQFENKNMHFRKIISKLVSREKSKEFWSKVEKALKPLEYALQAKTNMKARAKLLSGDYS